MTARNIGRQQVWTTQSGNTKPRKIVGSRLSIGSRPAHANPAPFAFPARLTSAVAIRAALRAYFRFEIEGRERLPRNQSFVMVANHASHLDAVSLLSALPLSSLNQAYPVAARDYFCAN